MKTIIVTISPTGESTVETKGYTGPSCRDGSRFIEEALGVKVSESLTPEYHKAPVAERRLTQ